jgi:ubiquinone/menaquinone biosynthesis C-methylase UbiE
MPNKSHDLVAEWEASYSRRENYVFWPGDETIRFVSRYLRKKTGPAEFRDVALGAAGSKVLDIGCGIGRNLVFGTQMGLDMYGSDHSATAVGVARRWLANESPTPGVEERVRVADVRELPWKDLFFAHAICDSVLDSMPFEIAQHAVAEIARVLQPGGYFYCNLISGDETGRSSDYEGEVIVDSAHEKGTTQSYFSYQKILRLLDQRFTIIASELHQVTDQLNQTRFGRWHIISRRL